MLSSEIKPLPVYTARLIELEADYPMVCEWWTAHGWPAVPRDMLPKLGCLVELDGVPKAAAWLYMDNSVGVAMLEWTVTNPGNTPRESLRSINHLLGALKEVALENDYGVVLAALKNEGLIRAFEKFGFHNNDSGITHLTLFTRP